MERVLAVRKRSVVAFDRSQVGPDRKQAGFHDRLTGVNTMFRKPIRLR
jgi:hypothetical protein